MTTFNTGNAVPSADARDRFDNSQTFDEVINGTFTYYVNRVGANVMSVKGMETLFNAAQSARANEYAADKEYRDDLYASDKLARDTEFADDQSDRAIEFNQFLLSSGYETPVDYAPGISIARPTQIVRYLGELYRPKDSALPFVTTTFAADVAKWIANGDNSLRQELALPSKAGRQVAWTRAALTAVITNVQQALDARTRSIWEYAGLVVSKPTLLDPSTWDWTPAFAAAFAAGGTLDLSSGDTYKCTNLFVTVPLSIRGNGANFVVNSVRVKTSNFFARDMKMSPQAYASANRGFFSYAYEDAADYENINIERIQFSGYFYSTDFRARGYDATAIDPTNRTIKGINILGCTSTAPVGGVNAGHFQHIGCSDILNFGNHAYGGIGAASYNFINSNTNVKCSNNYDQNNTYASFELENSGASFSVVQGNTFGGDLWIDDTSNVSVSGNTVAGLIKITSQTIGVDNVSITGNTCGRITCTKFGTGPTEKMSNLLIVGNTCRNPALVARSLLIDDFVMSARISGNTFKSVDGAGQAVALTTGATSFITMINNTIEGTVATSGTVANITEYGNTSAPVAGAASIHISRLLVPSAYYLDLPGKYAYPGRYSGLIGVGGVYTSNVVIPALNDLASRVITATTMFRNMTTNVFASFKQDIVISHVGGALLAALSAPYGAAGILANQVTLSATVSADTNVVLSATNGTGDQVQIAIILEVSSQMSEIA